MTLEQIIRKQILYEDVINKVKKINKINLFYKIDIAIHNANNQEEEPPVPPAEQPPVEQPDVNAAQPGDENLPLPDAGSAIPPETQEKIQPGDENLPLPPPAASVQTEDEASEDEEKVTNKEEIVRKTEGEINLTKEDVDNFQTIDDILDFLADKKVDGTDVLDDFSVEVIKTMINPEAAQKASELIDKKDHIFIELILGRKKEEENIGIRVSKRKNSDSVTTVMLKDGEIIAAPFNIQRLNDQLLNVRNQEFSNDDKYRS